MRIMCLCHFEYVPCTAYRQKYIVLLNLNLSALTRLFSAGRRVYKNFKKGGKEETEILDGKKR